MPPLFLLITALLLAPLAAFAQAKPEVANATKAAKRAWESASAFSMWGMARACVARILSSNEK
jgi:hypothetical protein